MKIITLFCSLLLSTTSFAMEQKAVTISSPKLLRQKLNEAQLLDFANHSRIAERLGDKECSKQGVEFAIRTAVTDYQYSVLLKTGNVEHLQELETTVKKIILT